MKIRDIMSSSLEMVPSEALLPEVAKKMRVGDSGSVLVTEGDRVVGVITDRDIAIRCVAEAHHPGETEARQIMTAEVLYCQETDEADEVADKMSKDKVRCLVVLDDKKHMVGTVLLGDLVIVKKTKQFH